MQSTSEGCLNIAELANQLRREKIFINSERQLLQDLNESVAKSSLELLQVAWICSQQRQNLNTLYSPKSEAESIAACQRASLLEGTTFIDIHKVCRYKEANALGELLGWLRDSPHLVALCLLLGEEHMPHTLPTSLIAGLYGSCRSQSDRTRLLAVMRSLIKHQMAPYPDPRKLLSNTKCAFTALYMVFRDGHTPARQFLTAALRAPVMAVLMEDDFFLDIEPEKALERFSPADRVKKFGEPNSPEYNAKVARYRKWTVQSLFNLTNKFIVSLREHWANFPAALSWILQQMVHLLKQHARTPERELHAICTDLVFSHLICPAICKPSAHGIVDVPVSYIARCNLAQIAQILHTLCLLKHQEVERSLRDLYSRFEPRLLPALLDALLAGGGGAGGEAGGGAEPALRTAPPHAAAALLTRQEALQLITFLQRISSKLNNNTPSVTSEEASSSSGPVAEAAAYSSAGSEGSSSGSEGCASSLAALLQSLEPNYRSRLHDLLKKVPDFTKYRSSPELKDSPVENGLAKKGILAKVAKPRLPRSASSNSTVSLSSSEDKPVNGDLKEEGLEHPEVLIIRLANVDEHDYVGLVPESKVLECYYGGSEAGDADETASALAVVGPGVPVQKRTRFSISHDEVSLGNTSDNLEAVSEANSNHSVTSSLELEPEDQNDNLSDMVSANVSGRGSPNISGRETPSSQVTDGDAANEGPPRRPPQNLPVSQAAANQQAKLLKQTRNDIEDKFCKFEIRKLLEGDETISIMSDTWSTDVLASDSETIGDSCDHAQLANNQSANTSVTNAPDVSETASESAWSMDVLASDSDRNTEVDTDDCVSVAARSDTSWPRRPSNQEDSTPVRTPQQNNVRRPDTSSPRHTSRPILPNRSGGGYLTATAALSRGAELDLSAAPRNTAHFHHMDHRKSILVNGYPVMTCYATSAPESPSTCAPAPLPNDVFDYPPSTSSGPPTESTLDGNSAATSQWVDDSFPTPSRAYPAAPPRAYPAPPPRAYPAAAPDDDSGSERGDQPGPSYDRRFEPAIDAERPDAMADLVTRMSAANISAADVTATSTRLVTTEIRTSVVSISSSRIERREKHSSEMSVNSVETSSDMSSSQDVNSEIVTERRISPPPPPPVKSTGAIPKSISFDATAEKSQLRRRVGEEGLANNFDELKNNVKRSGGNLFNKIKMFRQKGRSHHSGSEVKLPEEEPRSDEVAGASKPPPEPFESCEEILAKYRRKSSGEWRRRTPAAELDSTHDRCEGVVDLNDPEVFNSMKRKLRVVMSNPDLHCVEYVPNRNTSASLVEWVRSAAARSSSESSGARAGELARALAAGAGAAPRLAAALRADLAARRPYQAYLASCRAALTHTLHALNRQISGVRSECRWCADAAAAARTLDQLERSGALRRLYRRHVTTSSAELMDEKAARLTANIKAITAEIRADPSWEGATPALLEMSEITVERAAFARLYLHVMFPNGDGDIARDQVLQEHIRRLGLHVSAAAAGVPARHLWAAPYPRAHAHLAHLPVYRTPRDKLSCIMRCVTCIMAVLGLTEGSVPAADDLTPVLVYVIIRVNPVSLLSTIELVNALGGSALQGEALYWWTHFCAAVAYIKTMDYPRHPDS